MLGVSTTIVQVHFMFENTPCARCGDGLPLALPVRNLELQKTRVHPKARHDPRVRRVHHDRTDVLHV